MSHCLNSIKLKGYRPFRDLEAEFDPLVIIVGANGSGKSSLFEFFRFLRDAVHSEIPPEVVSGSVGQNLFHSGGPDRFWWSIEIDTGEPVPIRYQGELTGPISQKRVSREFVKTKYPLSEDEDEPYVFMNINEREGVVQNVEGELERQEIELQRPNQLALSSMTNPKLRTLYGLRNYIRGWRFYNAFDIDNRAIRKPTLTEPDPVLHEDASNLSSVLFTLMTEHRSAFEKLERHMRRVVPGFENLNVVSQGAKGEVIAQWDEGNVDEALTLADLSDGILRLLCWMTLAVQPDPPPLICIDEPAQGIHPRALPTLAGLFKKASERTQLLLATHSSYFLSQFDADSIAVMRKQKGEAVYTRASEADTLARILEDFGGEELETMHRSDEFEALT
jgi:predicted ATPase